VSSSRALSAAERRGGRAAAATFLGELRARASGGLGADPLPWSPGRGARGRAGGAAPSPGVGSRLCSRGGHQPGGNEGRPRSVESRPRAARPGRGVCVRDSVSNLSAWRCEFYFFSFPFFFFFFSPSLFFPVAGRARSGVGAARCRQRGAGRRGGAGRVGAARAAPRAEVREAGAGLPPSAEFLRSSPALSFVRSRPDVPVPHLKITALRAPGNCDAASARLMRNAPARVCEAATQNGNCST